MVNDNIGRNLAVTRNLEFITVYTNNVTHFYKGSDIADFKIEKFGNDTKISILTIEGESYISYNAAIEILYHDQEKLKSTLMFEEFNHD